MRFGRHPEPEPLYPPREPSLTPTLVRLTMPESDRVPRLARPFVVLLIAALITSAVFAWEPWPLTSFRLFSHPRADEQTRWLATAVGPDGRETPYPLGSLPSGFRGFPFVMAEFVGADPARRNQLCRTWVGAVPELLGREAAEVRLYLRRWQLSRRRGDRALPGTKELMYTCTSEGTVDAS